MQALNFFYALNPEKTAKISVFVRCFPALLLLVLLICQQFLFVDFIDAKLSLWVYGLCFCVLFLESLFLLFYKENQKINFEPLLLLVSAVFLISLPFFIQELSFFFLSVFLSSVLIFSFLFLNKVFLASLFFIYTLALLPLGLFALQDLSLKAQKTFTVFSLLFVSSFFVFAFLLRWFLNIESKNLKKESEESKTHQESAPDISALLSLNFARKLRPFFNSFLKQWPGQDTSEDSKKVIAKVFSSQKVASSLKKINNYINDFLEYMDLDKKAFSLSTIDVHELLQDILKEWEDHPKKPEKLEIKKDFPSDSLWVRGSRSHLKLAFQKIILNAFEALSQEKAPELKISTFKQTYGSLIQFTDNGPGLEEEDLNKIFDPFFSTKEFGKGLRGFGLAYVQKMIQTHSGKVKAERLEKGTLITVELPLIEKSQPYALKTVKKLKKTAS